MIRLLRLGDENKIALVTVLNASKKPKYDKTTWDLYRYADGGKIFYKETHKND